MAQIFPFREAAFDPEEIEVMDAALDKARGALRLSDVPGPISELLAGRIIEFTRRGDSNPDRICARALQALGLQR